MKPYCHGQPYLFGILLGYVLWKRRGTLLSFHWTINGLLWIASLATLFAVTFALCDVRSKNRLLKPSYSGFEAAAYNALSKVGWSLALFCVVFLCSKGSGGVINRFLAHGIFRPVAKLSYMVFLIHQPLILAYMAAQSTPMELSHLGQVCNNHLKYVLSKLHHTSKSTFLI